MDLGLSKLAPPGWLTDRLEAISEKQFETGTNERTNEHFSLSLESLDFMLGKALSTVSMLSFLKKRKKGRLKMEKEKRGKRIRRTRSALVPQAREIDQSMLRALVL